MNKLNESASRRLRAGIIGGGRGSFIGAVHRIAAELDGQALVVAGAMSSDMKTARQSAAAWFLERSYDSYVDMARAEAARPDGIDFAIIATPNDLHLPVASAFLEAGIHVVCDKPLALNLGEGERLAQLVAHGKSLFALTHAYAGYPLVRQAREMVAAGQIGDLRKVLAEYSQDWLMEPIENAGNKQAEWRADPARSGISGCVGDIGTHAQHLLEYISGRRIIALCADLTSFVSGRVLDDDANMLVRLEGGAKGSLTCSQVACGEANRLSIRLYGSRAAIEWNQEDPNTLLYKPAGEPWQRLRTGARAMGAAARAATRTPAGHPEGYLEAFANIYRAFIDDIRRVQRGEPPQRDYPDVADGLRGLRFVTAAVESSRNGGTWAAL